MEQTDKMRTPYVAPTEPAGYNKPTRIGPYGETGREERFF